MVYISLEYLSMPARRHNFYTSSSEATSNSHVCTLVVTIGQQVAIDFLKIPSSYDLKP